MASRLEFFSSMCMTPNSRLDRHLPSSDFDHGQREQSTLILRNNSSSLQGSNAAIKSQRPLSTRLKMTQQMNNLSRLINKYSNRFGAQDLLVLDLKKEMSLLQSKQEGLILSRPFSIPSDREGKTSLMIHERLYQDRP